MKFLCAAGKHYYNTEDKADACSLCRRTKDAKVRKVFKRESDEMLKAAGIEPVRIDFKGSLKDPKRS